MLRAKCVKCGTIIEVEDGTKEYKKCKCGAINIDGGDEFYYRVGGNPDCFDVEWANENDGVCFYSEKEKDNLINKIRRIFKK